MEVAIIVGAIIQMITLIVFFVMAHNVAKINKKLQSQAFVRNYMEMAEEEKSIGNNAKAKEYLLRAKYRCGKTHSFDLIELTDGECSVKDNAIVKIDELLSELI